MSAGPRSINPRALYLSFYFPPSRASGVYRGLATANHLAAHGWDVTVLACPIRFLHEVIGSVDQQLATAIDPRITVERPDLNQFSWEHDLRRFSWLRRTMPALARAVHNIGQRHLFPEPYATWGLSALSRSLRMHLRRPFDVVLATGNPFVSFATAWTFTRITGVPYVVDYRDSWTLNLFTDEAAFPDGHPAWRWERRVLRRASASVFVNDALRSWHAERYPEVAPRMMVVPNGWDPDLVTEPDDHPPHSRPHTGLRFGYLGTVTAQQPLDQLAAAFERARQAPELADAELHIHGHLGFFRNSPHEIRDRLGLGADGPATSADHGASGIRYRGPVSKTDVASFYRETDVLVFMAGGGRYVTSGKIFEYMASGRPIVSVHAPGIAATEVLEGYPLWFNGNGLDIDDLARAMIAAGRSARCLTPEHRLLAQRHADTYARARVLAPLEERLRTLATRR